MKSEPTLDRLRAANPVPGAMPADDEPLFARITAMPRDAAAPKRRRNRRRLVLLLAPVAAILIASSAFGISTWLGNRAVEPPVTRAEYLQAQHQLILPPGYHWPAPAPMEPNSMTTVGGGGSRAVLVAKTDWECYWADAIKRGDKRAGRAAQAQLNDLTTRHAVIKPDGAPEDWVPPHPPALPYTVWANDGGLQWFREGYKMAANGDASRLNASCRANRP
jgi:hypothetical protein